MEKEMEKELHYPSLYLEWEDDYELPESGTLTVTFKRRSETNRKDAKGKTSQSVELEILSIEDVEKGKVEKKSARKESEEAIDKLAKEAGDEDEDY